MPSKDKIKFTGAQALIACVVGVVSLGAFGTCCAIQRIDGFIGMAVVGGIIGIIGFIFGRKTI